MSHVRRFLILILALAVSRAAAQSPVLSFDDLALRSIQFVDRTEGWAAGDQGVIWHTIDGGKTWDRQKSGTRGSLTRLHFLTPYTGFAVGRTETPRGSSSVILKTVDGGLNWIELSGGYLPGLHSVHFFDEQNGIVCGDCTPVFPTGLFKTTDGGTTWKPMEGPMDSRAGGWRAMALRDAAGGRFVGSSQRSATINQGKLIAEESPKESTLDWSAVACDAANCVALGSHGTLAIGTFDGTMDHLPLLPNLYQGRGVAIRGTNLWVIGRPGSVVFHSPDRGKTWVHQKTNSNVTLNAIHMLSESEGWCCGDMGTVLNTTDGGKTWTIQRSGGQRCAVLAIHADAAAAPWDVIARLAAKDGYHVGVVQVGRTGCELYRLNEAVRFCGGSIAETGTLPLPDSLAELTSAQWNNAWSTSEVQSQLVLAIRIWKPETILTDPAGSGAQQSVRENLLKAVELAADAKAFPEQLSAYYLVPHKVSRVFAVSPTTAKADLKFENDKLIPELADTPAGFCAAALTLLNQHAGIPDGRFFEQLLPATGAKLSALVEEALLPRGGTARRKTLPPQWPAEYLDACGKIAAACRQVDQIVAKPEGSPEKVLDSIRNALVGLPEDRAARTALSAAKSFARAGQWGYAREMHAFTAEVFTPYAEAAESAQWLVRFHTSSEVKRRIELGHVKPLPPAMFDDVDAGTIKPAGWIEGADSRIRFRTGDSARAWNQFALDLEPKLASFGPAVAREPVTLRCLALAKQRSGVLLPKAATPAKATVAAVRASKKPNLDGKLDDACWSGTPQRLTSEMRTAYPVEYRFAYDDQYLYVAITGSHPEGRNVPKVEKRDRDADLTGHDRVSLEFDLDRDGETAYRFQVDHRGCLREDCWGDVNWNPKWFVAFDSNTTGWTAEIAIPLSELTTIVPAGQTWNVRLKRVIPDATPASDVTGPWMDLQFPK